MEFKIPLRNRNKEIIDYSIVSEIDYLYLNEFKWCKRNTGKYVVGCINKKMWKIHRYIMIEILKNDIDSKTIVDHIDSNPIH
jgi:hypothetical protein